MAPGCPSMPFRRAAAYEVRLTRGEPVRTLVPMTFMPGVKPDTSDGVELVGGSADPGAVNSGDTN